ncbi:MFS transporter [Porticoccaceae bacterium]|nr:MFS transporter [Porticoccaceae bacterium]
MPRFEYKHYLLGLLTLVAAFNFLDRGVLSLVMEPIKQEFQLSDSQLGFMGGFAFALFYAVAGIPIARWADRGNRNHVISLTTMLWSIMLVISGLVSNFVQLLLVRVGVAVGESGCTPPAQSLIAEYFSRAERPRAMAIYWMSLPLSTILAYLVGGWLVEQFGWRITVMIIGIPGVLLAVLVKFTLREPRLNTIKNSERLITPAGQSKPEQESLLSVLKALWEKSAFRHLSTGFCVSYFFGGGISLWIPAFFMRSYGMEAGELGTWLAFTWGLGGAVLYLFRRLFGDPVFAQQRAFTNENSFNACRALLRVPYPLLSIKQ